MTPWEQATYHRMAINKLTKHWHALTRQDPFPGRGDSSQTEIDNTEKELRSMFKEARKLNGYLRIHSFYRPLWLAAWS